LNVYQILKEISEFSIRKSLKEKKHQRLIARICLLLWIRCSISSKNL